LSEVFEAEGWKSVPDCTIEGVWPVARPWSSYQRTPSRVSVPDDEPVLFTPMFSQVQSRPLRKWAAISR